MLRNLASSLFLTERDDDFYGGLVDAKGAKVNPPIKGRVVTTIQKAKEVRSLVEKCITLAKGSLKAQEAAEEFATGAERGSVEWKEWRQSDEWQQWNHAIAPDVAARRRALRMLGDKEAVRVLFNDVAPRFVDRDGGYTRVLRLAKPRLGDAGTRAILELVGKHDRVVQKAQKPAFDDEEAAGETEQPPVEEEVAADAAATEEQQEQEPEGVTEGETEAQTGDAPEEDAEKE